MAVIEFQGKKLSAESGQRLSDVLLTLCPLDMPCGGQGRCGKCKVLTEGEFSPLSEPEKQRLTAEEIRAGIRLACCAEVRGDGKVSLPAGKQEQIQLAGVMPSFPIEPSFSAYGAAVDIGTTTLAAVLYSSSGELLAQASRPNPQKSYGADVISRVDASIHGKKDELASCIRQAVGEMLLQMCRQASVPVSQVDGVVLTGNTVMLYLLTGTDADCLSHAPFEADRLFGEELTGEELSLPCLKAAVYLPPCMSSFVGADITAAVLASGIADKEGTRLLADIGTNGEIALRQDGALYVCSTAAGPAFEGAGLSMGMGGKSGAVDHVWVESGKLKAHVIGDTAPEGICGSGVIDAAAALLDTGQLDETGRLEEDPAVILAPVSLSQKDIRMVQLAKSAICSGIRTLLQARKVPMDQVEELAVAGGFGSYLNVERAGRIGLIPAELAPRVRILGNAALSGAAMVLLSRPLREKAVRLAAESKTFDLTTSPVFMELYTDNMFF